MSGHRHFHSDEPGHDDAHHALNHKIQELQVVEHHLQQLLAEKQALQVELNEVSQALEEARKASGEIYKVLSGVMLLADKKGVLSDLEERKRILELKLKSHEKQENTLGEKAQALRVEINTAVGKKDSRE